MRYPVAALRPAVLGADDRLAAVLDDNTRDPHKLMNLPALAVEGVDHVRHAPRCDPSAAAAK